MVLKKKTTKAATAAKAPVAKKATARKGPARKGGFPARKAGAGGAATKSARKPLPTFQAPQDFKPFFLEVSLRTERDGLLGNGIKATRYVGRYDPNAEDKKKFDIGSYDVPTLIGVQARLAAVLYKTNAEKKYPADPKLRNKTENFKHEASGETRQRLVYRAAHRLPPATSFKVLLRINRKAADGSLSVVLKQVQQGVKSAKTGRLQAVTLDKKDPVYRAFGKARRILPAAFKDVLLPPKRTRGRKVEDSEE